jgi:hypothetical protein
MKQRRQVWALTKKVPGETSVFPNTKDAYTVQENGSVVNANPKPYRGKAERKIWLRNRRLDRLTAAVRKANDEA